MRSQLSVAILVLLVAGGTLVAAEAAPQETLDKPRIMLLPDVDAAMLSADEGGATLPPPLLNVAVKRPEALPARCVLLVQTLLSRELLKKRFRMVDPAVAERIGTVYTRLREFRDVSTASGTLDSVAQQIAYQYHADVICFYKLLVHKAEADRDAPAAKAVRDSVQVRVVGAATGRLLATDERTSAGLSDADEYLAHRMAIERILLAGGGGEAKGLAAYVADEVEGWWAEFHKTGRPVSVNFYLQGDDARLLTALAALLKSEGDVQIVGTPASRRVVNSEQTHEIFAEYEVNFVGAMIKLQGLLVQKIAELKGPDGKPLADKYRITVDAFGDHVTICLLDPERQEIRERPAVVPGGDLGGAVPGAPPAPAASPQAVAEAARRATVLVRSYTKEGEVLKPLGHGSGAVLTPDGVVVTNAHVVSGGKHFFVEFEARTPDLPSPQFEAEVLRQMPDRDLALLKIKLLRPGQAAFDTLKLGRSADLRVGDSVVAVGAPFSPELINNVTFGTVSSLGRLPEKFIVHTAPIYHGNSGGPLLNLRGEIVGINAAGMAGPVVSEAGGAQKAVGRVTISGFSLAIPADLVSEMLR